MVVLGHPVVWLKRWVWFLPWCLRSPPGTCDLRSPSSSELHPELQLPYIPPIPPSPAPRRLVLNVISTNFPAYSLFIFIVPFK
ncbi:hypothetical protein ASPSYDRAFT_44828 [Aspergillus sydowii CBS 593.65]|uniref:Secreted protein n=1 Tax=Aspergillus sydowii CBS 593.65 TaxID=1036612 RepID=A0A1L9TGB4_9EURO|nr:uncharacterized protein ASPSYDRAFT_44828 [Aspergillus sydowii CBS 593.65]OJJ58479.1 hypothetical protein ASPSYDRAFT_44828 [Aspergillus sydowii CBS 593.65]